MQLPAQKPQRNAWLILVMSLSVVAGLFGRTGQQVFAQVNTPTQPLAPAQISAPVTDDRIAEIITLTAIPPRLGDDGKLIARPGDKLQIQLRVNNPTSQPINTLSTATDFVLDSDGATPLPVAGGISNRWSLANWMVLSPAEQVIQPGQTVGINVLIEVPEDALPGGHYAMVTHQPQLGSITGEENPIQPNSAAGVTQKVGTLVYLIVDGPINEEAFVRNLQFPDLIEYGPIPFTFSIENMSDTHITPQITVEFSDWLGKTVDKIPVTAKNVFPLSTREFEGRWDKIWGFGRYKALVTVSYGQSGKIAQAVAHFWLIPITLIVAAIIVLLTVVGIVLAIRRHLRHRNDERSQKIAELEAKVKQLEKETEDLE